MNYLGNTIAVVSLAKTQKVNNDDMQTFFFNHRVNNRPEKFWIIYPLRAYISLKQYKFYNYRPSYFSFQVQLEKYSRQEGETPEMVKEKFKKLETQSVETIYKKKIEVRIKEEIEPQDKFIMDEKCK